MWRESRFSGLLLLAAASASAQTTTWSADGHVKGRLLGEWFPENSVFETVVGDAAASGEADIRFRMSGRKGAWSVDADYQAFAILGDSVKIANSLALSGGPATVGVLDDELRWFDLTHTFSERDDRLLIHRFDRLALTWTSERAVVRFGRQALSWGGGLFFSPFDIVNPLDPAAVDTEYKTGDDMLYGQYLRDSGDDLQFALVGRRHPSTGALLAAESTAAIKYHGILGESEYDLLVARNRDRTTLGVGGNVSIGGAVLRADVVLADGDGWTVEALANLSYSWIWRGRNLTGAIEYFYNGWGLSGGRYSLADISAEPELALRLARGETFSIARNYLAAGATIELSPLWLLTPNLFMNLDDPSALLQVVLQHSLGDNLVFLAALNASLGPDGSEFGGIEATIPGRFFSRDAGLFAQLAWYF